MRPIINQASQNFRQFVQYFKPYTFKWLISFMLVFCAAVANLEAAGAQQNQPAASSAAVQKPFITMAPQRKPIEIK